MFKVIVYKTGFTPTTFSDKPRKRLGLLTEDSLQRSVRRSRAAISDYCGVNDFEWFVTFTFNPKKVNRYDLSHCYTKMQGWLWRTHRKNEDFKYIIVPERHKDGAIHFHALISGYDLKIKKTNVIQNNRRVYNITGFTYGFTNAQRLDDDTKKTVAYMCKYITKDMELVQNRRRYWCSKNLRKPEKFVNSIYDLGIARFINPTTTVMETDYNVVHEIPKHLMSELT